MLENELENESELMDKFDFNDENNKNPVQKHDIKESLEFSKIMKNSESHEMISENLDVDDLIYQLQEGELKNMNKILKKFKCLLKEDKEIVEYFSSKIYNLLKNIEKKYNGCEDIKQLTFLFEALLHEQKIRTIEKSKCFKTIQSNFENKVNMSKISENLLNKLNQEVKLFKQLNELKKKRHAGTFKKVSNNMSSSTNKKFLDVYDWIVDIDLITKINKEGWKINFSPHFLSNSSKLIKQHIIGNKNIKKFEKNENFKNKIGELLTVEEKTKDAEEEKNFEEKKKNNCWEGAIVAVVGLYDKGKTFVLNNLSTSNLPSGKKVNTKGLSFKYVNIENGTKLILLDTAGSYSPVRVVNNLSIIEKEATEMFILDLVFDISDYFIFVVNDFTSLDQRYLDKLTRSLHNSPNKSFREVIVIHNFKEVESEEILNYIWEIQVKQIYEKGSVQKTVVAALNPLTSKLEEKPVIWFKSDYTRHVCLVNQDSILGLNINPWTFSLLKYWLKAVFIPINRKFSVVESVINSASHKLSSYFKADIDIVINDTDDELVKTIKNQNNLKEGLRLPQIAIDSSGFVMTRPDSFLPNCDIIKEDEYIIIMDIPGMTSKDIKVIRQNVHTIVKGVRKKLKDQNSQSDKAYEKNERKFGDFTIRFKIPEEYERKWSKYTIKDGVLMLKYKKDIEENEIEADKISLEDC